MLWSANIPSWMADQYISNLQQLKGIALDGGNRDSWSTGSKYFSDVLTKIKIKNSLEIYEGDHTNKLTERFYNNILPFFSEMLIREE